MRMKLRSEGVFFNLFSPTPVSYCQNKFHRILSIRKGRNYRVQIVQVFF